MILAKKHNQYPATDKKTGRTYTQYVYALTQVTTEQLAEYHKFMSTRKDKSGKSITKAKLKTLIDDDGNQLIWSQVAFPFGDSENLPAFQKEDGNILMDRGFLDSVKETVEAFKVNASMQEFRDTYFQMKESLVGSAVAGDNFTFQAEDEQSPI